MVLLSIPPTCLRPHILARRPPPSRRPLVRPHPRRVPRPQPLDRVRQLRPQPLGLDLCQRIEIRLEAEQDRLRLRQPRQRLQLDPESCSLWVDAAVFLDYVFLRGVDVVPAGGEDVRVCLDRPLSVSQHDFNS